MTFLSVSGLSVSYGRIGAIREVDLSVEQGQLLSVVGPNGAGKTTLMKAIAGLEKPAAGRIELDGKPIQGLPPERIARLGLSLVPEGRHVFDTLTVSDNLFLGSLSLPRKGRSRELIENAVSYFPALEPLLGRRASTLSGGEQQMLAIARGLVSQPRILVLDEPTLGLAPQIVGSVFASIERLHAEGTTIVLVEQNSHRALALADVAVSLHKGAVRARATRLELSDESSLRKFADETAGNDNEVSSK